MDLNQILIFAKVAENQSFTKAAQELGIEKSTVSSKISQLEKRLGVRLLNRTTRRVTLTEAGQGYYLYCHQIVETAREADHYADTHTSKTQGILRVSVSLDFGQLLVQTLIRPFLQTYPDIKIDLHILDREVDLIAERFDIALRIGPGVLKDSSLIAKKLFDVNMGLFASPSLLVEYGEPKKMDNLRDYPFIFFNKEQEPLFEFASGFMPTFFQTKGNLKINDILTCKEAAISGLGIALLPIAIAEQDVESKQLIPVTTEHKLPSMTLFAVYPSRQWVPSKLAVFLQFLQKWQ